METIKEIFQSIYDSYRDRIKSPLVGSFIVTYLIFNWRLLAILFYSEWPIHCRIEWIEENYCNWYNYLVPFLISLFYVLALPYINLGFEKVLNNYSETKLDKKNRSKIESLIQKKEEAKIKKEIADAEAGTSEIVNLNTTITNLTSEIETLTDRHQKEVERLKNSENKSNDILKQVQKELDQANKEKNKLSTVIDKARNDAEQLFVPTFVKKTLDKLTLDEKLYFLNLCDFRIFNTRNSISHNTDSYIKFVKMELFTGNDPSDFQVGELTEKGQYVYHILKNTL